MAAVSCRSIKRTKVEIPDYYPQASGQKEDELTEENVKCGYTNQAIGNVTPHEYSSAQESITQVPISKFATAFNSILIEKQKSNTFQDVNKKKPQAQSKEFFLPITSKTKSHLSSWLQELADGKPLSHLESKKVPIFNKKEELLNSVCEHSVPLIRATWFIKMTSAHQMALISDSRNKKRQASDPAQEWTSTITKYLKDQLNKLSDFYHQSFQRMSADVELAQKQWHYTVRLTDWLYEENLLDRQEFFHWVVELMEKMKNDDVILKLILPVVLRYLDQIVHSQVLSRSLALCCARKLSTLLSAAEQMRDEQKQNANASTSEQSPSPNVGQPSKASNSESDRSQPSLFTQYKSCAHHQSLVNGLSCILQVITLCCPGALIWNSTVGSRGSNEQSSKKAAAGSALDRLALSPSELPLPTTASTLPNFNKQIEKLLISKEEEIKSRSKAVEKRWFVDTNKTSVMEVNKILEILDYLDKQNFNKVEGSIATEHLYSKIFASLPKDCTKVSPLDEAVTILLIQWAISAQRLGKHRAIIVSTLLKKRQSEMRDQLEKLDGDEDDETSSKTSSSAFNYQYFQNVALKFLDQYAPVWEDDETTDGRFCQLVMLYGELIRLDVFSHNSYICTLISRGDLESSHATGLRSNSVALDNGLNEGNRKTDVRPHDMLNDSITEDGHRTSDSTSELNKQLGIDQELMLHQEQLQKLLYQDSGSPDDGLVSPFAGSSAFKFDEFRSEKPSNVSVSTDATPKGKEKSQHDLYVKHFPIPKEENTHELNQRLVVLYGVGRPRHTAMKSIKEFGKELVGFMAKLGELAGKEIDDDQMKMIADKKQSLYRKFCSFPTFDQYSWVAKCMAIMRELASSHAEDYGLSALYPTFGQLSLMIDLFEMCCNIHDMLEFLVDLLEVRSNLKFNPNVPQETSVFGTLPTKSLLVLGTLQKHQSILLLYSGLAIKTFFGFLRTVENISDPAVCTSTERCVLAYLYYLYTCSTYIKTKSVDSFDTACNKIKESIITFCNSTDASSPLTWNTSFLSNYFENARKEQLDNIWKREMVPDKPDQIYSFICNAVSSVYSCQDRERLYDIGVLCSEVTAHYKELSSKWITVLKALCCSSPNATHGYTELVVEVEINDTSFHEFMCYFVMMLVSRSCFSVEDLIYHALLPALCDAVDSENKIILDAEAGAQLTCRLLYRLLDQSSDISQETGRFGVEKFSYEPTPDRALLCAAQENIPVGVVFDVLKAIMKFSEAESRRKDHDTSLNVSDDIFGRGYFNTIDYDLIDVGPGQANDVFSSSKSGIESTNASAYATEILQKLCSQEWLKDKCLRDQNILFSSEALLDPSISDLQAKKLLHLICHANSFQQSFGVTDGFPTSSSPEMETCKEAANRILANLNHWSFRNSWLELFLMINKADKEQLEELLDCISSACLKVFVEPRTLSISHSRSVEKQDDFTKGPEWLVEPLINKLSSGLHGRILKTAGDVLGVKGWWKNQKETFGPCLVHTQPFLHLILSCLQTLGEQREPLLMSLLKQFQDLLEAPIEESHPGDTKRKSFLQDALDLRLRLVGVMFDSIANPKSLQMAADWAVVLFDLISCGILSTDCISGNFNHYTNVLDMLSVLMNLITSSESTSGQLSDDGRKFSSGVFKRLKRKLLGKNPSDIEDCKQLLPFPGRSIEVVTVEKSQHNDFSILSESQSSTTSNDETQEGFQVKGRQKISPWELIEGHKNPAPMAFSWFGAVRIERKPLAHQTDLGRAVHHKFVKKKPLSYYLNPPDDSDDESIDLNTVMLGSPGKLQSTLDPKGRAYTSMINLNAAVKRERMELRDAVVEQQTCDEKPKAKRPKKNTRAVAPQHQLTLPQQDPNFVNVNQMFQKSERAYQQQNPESLGVCRLQVPTGKPLNIAQSYMLLPKSQADSQQRNPTGSQQVVFPTRAHSVNQQRRGMTPSAVHVEESPIQQLLQSTKAYPFTSGQNPQLTVTSHTVLSAAPNTTAGPTSRANSYSNLNFPGNSVQQQQAQLTQQQQTQLNQQQMQLGHAQQTQLNQQVQHQQAISQSFLLQSQAGNLQQGPSILQHATLRHTVSSAQKQFPQGALNLPPQQQQDLRSCLLRQAAGQNNPATSQVNLQRQMSAPAKLSLPGQLSDVSFAGQMAQSQNLVQSSKTQQYPNFQPPFQ